MSNFTKKLRYLRCTFKQAICGVKTKKLSMKQRSQCSTSYVRSVIKLFKFTPGHTKYFTGSSVL